MSLGARTALAGAVAALVATRARAEQVLTLDEAERTGMANLPSLHEARAVADAAAARSDQARAALLPVLSGSASYQRATANIAAHAGTPPGASAATAASGHSYDYYSAGLSFSQLLWDFGQTTDRWRAGRAAARAQELTAESHRQQALLVIRTSYFGAQAARALVAVARETKENTGRHLEQISAFVDVGTRPEVDLARARTDRANAEVQLIQAENNYVAAKAQLNRAPTTTSVPTSPRWLRRRSEVVKHS